MCGATILRVFVVLGGALFAGLLHGCQPAALTPYHETRPLMGTVVDITTEGPDQSALIAATDAAFAEMSRLSDMMNHYNPDSVVSAINRNAGARPVPVPRELMQVLRQAQAVSARSGGAFDITVGSLRGWRFDPEHPQMPAKAAIIAMLPLVNYRNLILDDGAGTAFLRRPGMRIDLGGIAKLYILDAGVRVLKRHGVTHAMINGGGDVAVTGTIRGRPWRIGIRDPLHPESLYAAVEIERGFVVSSGDYERYFVRDGRRYHHILDPATGYPTRGPRAVTLVAEDMEKVNGLSAAIMVMGMGRGRALIEADPALQGIIFDQQGDAWVSPGLAPRLEMALPRAQ